MRAPGLLPLLPLLLPLLLLGVNSQDDPAAAAPEGSNKIATTTDTSKAQVIPTPSAGGTPPSSKPPTTVQTTTTTAKPETLASSATSRTTPQGTTATNTQRTTPPTSAPSPSTVQGAAVATTKQGNPTPAPSTPSPSSGQASSAASSGASTATSAAAPAATKQQTSPAVSLGSSGTTTTANPVLTHVRSPQATQGGSGAAATSRSDPQGSQPPDHSASATKSTGVLSSSSALGPKDCSPFSTHVTKQPHSSSSSPVQDLASSTRPGSINTSVTPLSGSVSLPTSKTSLTSPPGSIHKSPEAATTLTPRAEDPDQGSHDVGPTSAKPTSASRGPDSAQPSPPAPGDQTVPSHQHPNTSFQNEVICKDAKGAPTEVQNNWPTMYLKEAKTCAEWRTASANISFFESLCSTDQHMFNASRESCTVTLLSREPQLQHWDVQVVLHLPLHPENILKDPERKDKLEALGISIVNVTSDKMEREAIIDEFSTPLIITIVTLAGSLLLIAAIYGCCHQRFSQKKDQHIHPDLPGFDDGHVALIFNQRLTEELQTMENGYHDNPTLEVMETSSEMQEKKVNLNGELGDSWIVPLDTLMKEDLEEEEDTHL